MVYLSCKCYMIFNVMFLCGSVMMCYCSICGQCNAMKFATNIKYATFLFMLYLWIASYIISTMIGIIISLVF